MPSVLVITGDGLGRGDDSLGRRLMVKFLQQVAAVTPRPTVIAFYNAGVTLLVPESPVVGTLKELEADGADLIACGPCLDHFAIRTRLAAGRVSDMREIVTTIAAASKVVVV